MLNYLGYSWIDMGVHLDEGMDLIRKAVELRPRSGFIVDSLGWAYFRLGKYSDAVEQLERAVELMPSDPVVNDHLGDAYWRVGRKLEATFQWNHALANKPEAGDEARIKEKLQVGLERSAKGCRRCSSERASNARRPRLPDTVHGIRAGKGQPCAACHRQARRRLSRNRYAGSVRRYRRHGCLSTSE